MVLTKKSLARKSPNSLCSTQDYWPYFPCCFNYKEEGPVVSMKKNGTMVTVTQSCRNCGPKPFVWRSHPLVLGRYPAGNILLSFAILMAGASVSKVLLVLRHMGISIYSACTYFVHQSKFLFPAILTHKERYRTTLMNELKKKREAIWCSDGRLDSMGHSAKYGAYTMFCCAVAEIVHFELVQLCCHYNVLFTIAKGKKTGCSIHSGILRRQAHKKRAFQQTHFAIIFIIIKPGINTCYNDLVLPLHRNLQCI